MGRIVRGLTLAVRRAPLTAVAKLELQTVAWELYFGLYAGARDPALGKAEHARTEKLLDLAQKLLLATTLDREEIQSLPATAGSTAFPESELLSRLEHGDENHLELSIIDGLHAEHLESSHGRFHMRIFFTVDAAEKTALLQALSSANSVELRGLPPAEQSVPRVGPVPDVSRLMHRYHGFRALLVLFFNVLSHDLDFEPTPIVAFWHEYSIDGIVRGEQRSGAVDRLTCRSIGYGRSLTGNSLQCPRYRVASNRDPVPRARLFDVNPLKRAPATTHLGACLEWHGSRVVALSRLAMPDRMVITRPYYHSPEELVQRTRAFDSVREMLIRLRTGSIQ
jgi:hypothetical protein